MSEANKMLARRWFEQVWNQARPEAIDEMFARDGRAWGCPDPLTAIEGPAEFHKYYEQLHGAFPDVQITVDDVIAEGDKVAIRWTARMTHSGDHLGFKATGKAVILPGMSMIIVRDGMLHEGWNSADFGGMMAGLQN